MANISVKRSATATWNGGVPAGSGQITTQSGVLDAPYSFGRRFGGDPGTNPEELLGAAHAGCYSMAISYELTNAGFVPTSVSTKADVAVAQDDSGFTITQIDLTVDAVIANIDDAKFQEIAEAAKIGCPLSKALAAVPTITLKATLHAA
jgi:osmotically inducible protein OsmC